jgi:hypothetical protein
VQSSNRPYEAAASGTPSHPDQRGRFRMWYGIPLTTCVLTPGLITIKLTNNNLSSLTGRYTMRTKNEKRTRRKVKFVLDYRYQRGSLVCQCYASFFASFRPRGTGLDSSSGTELEKRLKRRRRGHFIIRNAKMLN